MPRKPAYLRQMEAWQDHLDARGYSQGTQKVYRVVVRKVYVAMTEAGFATAPRCIGPETAQWIISEALERRPEQIAAIKHFLKYCGNPILEAVEYIPKRQTRENADWLDLDANQDFQVWDEARSGTALEMALVHHELHLGMRRIECQRQLMAWYQPGTLLVMGKGHGGGKPRMIVQHPYTREVLAAVRDYREDCIKQLTRKTPYLEVPDNLMAYMCRREMRVPSVDTLDKWLGEISRRSGIPFSHHTLRRTCGRSIYIEQKKAQITDLPAIQQFLGHSSLDMTIKYLGINVMDQAEMMSIASRRFTGRKPGAVAP